VKAAEGRPVLTVAPPPAEPRERGPRHWAWVTREALSTALWHAERGIARALATRRHREQAWAEGFAVGLGGTVRTWRDLLDEWRAGNEVAHELKFRHHDRTAVRARLHPARTEGQALDAARRKGVLAVPPAAGLADVADEMAAEDAQWLADVAAAGRHAAPGRPVLYPLRPRPRHRRPPWRTVAARWLRRPSAGGAHRALRAAA